MKEKYDFTEISTLGRFFLESPEAGLLLSKCFCVTLSGKKKKNPFFRSPSRNTIESCYNKSSTNTTLLIHTEPDLNMSLIIT